MLTGILQPFDFLHQLCIRLQCIAKNIEVHLTQILFDSNSKNSPRRQMRLLKNRVTHYIEAKK